MADKDLRTIMEAFYNAAPYGNITEEEPEERVEGSVEFKQHRNTDKASLSIEASGDTMAELHKILKLAGIEMSELPDMPTDDNEVEVEPDDEEDAPKVITIKPAGEYNPIAGDKKEILNALMSRYKSV